MKKLVWISLLGLGMTWSLAAADVAADAKKTLDKVTPNTITYTDPNGWLYSKNELAHLAKGELVKGEIVKKSACKKAPNADPLPALTAFHKELQALGIKLILVPVPPKAAFEPFGSWKRGEAMAYLKPYYAELRAAGLNVLDLSEAFLAAKDKHCYCKTDAHWSPDGMALAAKELGKLIELRGNAHFEVSPVTAELSGDLARSLAKDAPLKEKLTMQVVKGTVSDENSPVLLLGDSHTLVFSTGNDMLFERAGLMELLAKELPMPIDRIGVKGSAATAVRTNLFRKAAKSPEWIKNKKYVIYCFSCREFTESTSGWVTVPVLKK